MIRITFLSAAIAALFIGQPSANAAEAYALRTVGITRSGKIIRSSGNFESLLSRAVPPDIQEFRGSEESREIELGTNSVIGSDARIRVTNTKTFPERAIGRIAIGCTGTLIGPRHVITAGHCVYNVDRDTWYTNLTFSAGRNGGNYPYGSSDWEAAYSVQGWTHSHDKDYDIGLIILKNPIGKANGWLGLGPSSSLNGQSITISGYPADKSNGTMWRASCAIKSVYEQSLGHHCDTYGGMSGSSMFSLSGGTRTVRGIHTYGGSSSNSGTRITRELYNKISSWIAAHR